MNLIVGFIIGFIFYILVIPILEQIATISVLSLKVIELSLQERITKLQKNIELIVSKDDSNKITSIGFNTQPEEEIYE